MNDGWVYIGGQCLAQLYAANQAKIGLPRAKDELAHVSPHPTTKQSHVKFTRHFVDSCHPSLSRAPNPPRFKCERVGFFFWSSVPPLRTLSTTTPSLAPNCESEGDSSCLSCPLQRLPPPRPTSTPPACALRQRPWPAYRVNAPGLRAASMPLACAPCQCPWPERRVNAPSLRTVPTPPACTLSRRPRPVHCVDTPGLRAVLTLLACALC